MDFRVRFILCLKSQSSDVRRGVLMSVGTWSQCKLRSAQILRFMLLFLSESCPCVHYEFTDLFLIRNQFYDIEDDLKSSFIF